MADLYPDIKYPKIDFSGIAALPQIAEATRLREGQREALSSLPENASEAQLRAAGNRLAQQGDLEGAVRLHTVAQQREALKQKYAADAAYSEYMKALIARGGLGGTGAVAPAPENAGDVSVTTPSPVAPAPPSSGAPLQVPAAPFPSPPGPQSSLPLPPPAAQAAATGELPPSPTEQVLAQAQGVQGPALGPQLAGPPPTPEAPPAPPAISPATVQGAQQPYAVAPPAPGVPPGRPMPAELPSVAEGKAAEIRVGNQILGMPPRTQGMPAFQVFMAQFRNALAKQKLSPDMESYQLDRMQSIWSGQGDISHADWKRDIQSNPERYKDTLNDFKEVQASSNKSQGTLNVLQRLDQISKDPNFVSGLASKDYGNIINAVTSLSQITGVDTSRISAILGRDIAPHIKAQALREEFTALSNSAVLASAGSLAKGFSEGDRTFTERIFPQILATPGGIDRIITTLKEMNEHNLALGKVAREYMSSTQKGARSTPWGLNNAIQQYNTEHPLFVNPDGTPTARGEKLAASTSRPTAPSSVNAGQRVYDSAGKSYIIQPDGTPKSE